SLVDRAKFHKTLGKAIVGVRKSSVDVHKRRSSESVSGSDELDLDFSANRGRSGRHVSRRSVRAPMCVYCGKNDHFVWSCSEYMSPDMPRKLVNAERWRVYAATLDDCDMRDERAELEDFRCDIRREEEFARGRGHTPDDYLVKPESRERAPRGRQRSHRDSAPPRDRAPPRDGASPQDRPANWQPLKRVQCYRCGGYGHFAKHCDGKPLPPAEQSKLKREIWERSKALRPYF
ncbi:hypothetical protein ADUPG1_002300, partial [Aduncisulcus paluster]